VASAGGLKVVRDIVVARITSRRSVDVTDPAAVRALLAELTEHAGDDLVTPTRLKHRMITRFLGHLHPDEVAGQLFTLSGHNLPVPTGPSVRMRYEPALASHAERLRAPELFVFPSAPYLSDRAAFRELFEQVQPPLVAYGDSGIVPTRRAPSWRRGSCPTCAACSDTSTAWR
jgi:hypothetical protein